MEAAVIQRQYDEVISLQYDQDPQNTTADSLERALDHLVAQGLLDAALPRLRVLDVGMGTGMFLEPVIFACIAAAEDFENSPAPVAAKCFFLKNDGSGTAIFTAMVTGTGNVLLFRF